MSKKIDEKIRDLVDDSDFELPPDYDMRVTRLLNNLEEKPGWFLSVQRAVALAAAFIFVFSFGTYAAINYMLERMKAMNHNEKDAYVNDVQLTEASTDYFSRPLTEKEDQKLEQLKQDYSSKGVFPEGALLQVDFQSEVVKDTLCFVTTTSTFYFPERDMTDEELLQFIDFYYKRDYSILEASSERIMENVVITAETEEETAVKTARKFLLNVYGVDLDEENYTSELVHYSAEIMDDIFWVTVEKEDVTYMVSVEAESGLFLSMQRIDTSESTQNISIDEAAYAKTYEDMKELLLTKIAPGETINNSYFEYWYDDNSILTRGIITYYFEMEEKVGYTLAYNYNTSSLQLITYDKSTSNFQHNLQTNSEYCQVHKLIQKIIEIP